MAAQNRKPKFYWGVSLVVFVAIISAFPLYAGDIDPSRYAPFPGDKFFLLSESTFGSDEEALVRLEAPARKEALHAYSGVDIRVYQISDPFEFLKKQKNLHRPVIEGDYQNGEAGNSLNYLWDSWYKKSRLVWQRVLSSSSRQAAVSNNPDVKQVPPYTYQTQFQNNSQFGKIPGLTLVDDFRYPLWDAKPVQPPKGVNIQGSSSEFLSVSPGNVFIPVGKRQPGLYVVEAIIGTFRATTLLFVADTVAVTKISGHQLLVWNVQKTSGIPVPNSKLLITDGVGTIASGEGKKDGVYVYEGKSLERSYVIGKDPAGGVFVSENFYYDSEIYGTKLYAFTDRPLYQPGDTVYIKIMGREFKSSRQSASMSASPVQMTLVDPAGTPLISKRVDVRSGQEGGDSKVQLPKKALAGGYTVQMVYNHDLYTSSFRVAHYVKPHFEIETVLSKKDFSTNEKINGFIKLSYPNGLSVKNADVEIEARKQRLTIIEGEVQSLDRFPVQVFRKPEHSDSDGKVQFELPAVSEPSRYLLNIRAVDKASYRVLATREVLVKTGSDPYRVMSEKNFSAPKEETTFSLNRAIRLATNPESAPVEWEAIRLQDRTRLTGGIKGGSDKFPVVFEKAGAYSIMVRDRKGNILGSAAHWVVGPELAGIPGTINILLDKDEYQTGETAEAVITLSENVQEALITLEGDKVERHALLSESAPWIKLEKTSGQQWRAKIPVTDEFSPNLTLSFAYVSGAKYVFENKGIKVQVPKVQIQFKPEKDTYAPGETVNVDVYTAFKERPVEALLAVSVVDEMVYVLQPEIAPDIGSFFYHTRRNQVRTSSSLNFHSFDAAVSAKGISASAASDYGDRRLKLQDRPRREEKDTALWLPKLKTDPQGHARFSFQMPESLTRWRMTGRAMTAAGMVGQRQDYLVSFKEAYLKESGPTTFRKGDHPVMGWMAFNMGSVEKNVLFEAKGPGVQFEKKLSLKPGSSFIPVPFDAGVSGEVQASIKSDNRVLDELKTPISIVPAGWLTTRSLLIEKQPEAAGKVLPEGALNIRLTPLGSAPDYLLRTVDDLIDYPYGCVEQTASRLIPLSIAYSLIASGGFSEEVREQIENRIVTERNRLVSMAGPRAAFSWWGDQTRQSSFITTYAYFADWISDSVLNIKLPAAHWEHVLETYKESSDQDSLFQKTVTLWLMTEMGLPTKTLTKGMLDKPLFEKLRGGGKKVIWNPWYSEVISDEESLLQQSMAAVLLHLVAKKNQAGIESTIGQILPEARRFMAESGDPLASAILLLERSEGGLSANDKDDAEAVLARFSMETPTIDRSLGLLFLYKSIGLNFQGKKFPDPTLGSDWMKSATKTGRPYWEYRGGQFTFPNALFGEGSKGRRIQLIYDSYTTEAGKLPIEIERKLYRLKQEDAPFNFVLDAEVKDWTVSTEDLYVDEIRIQPKGHEAFHFGLLRVPLPPGGDVDPTVWGMKFKTSDGTVVKMGEAGFQEGERSYSIPIETLNQSLTFYYLVRFSQPGKFQLPRSMYFRMYAPEEKAFEGGNKPEYTTVVIH